MDEGWKNLIMDHYKHPRLYGDKDVFTVASEQHNRTCGDHVKVFADLRDEKTQWSFIGAGCSLCLASASLMMELVQDQNRASLERLKDEFQTMWDKGLDETVENLPTWQALAGLRNYPVRSRCVKLAWQALDDILSQWPS